MLCFASTGLRLTLIPAGVVVVVVVCVCVCVCVGGGGGGGVLLETGKC